jgi:hypothetical protein
VSPEIRFQFSAAISTLKPESPFDFAQGKIRLKPDFTPASAAGVLLPRAAA